MEQFDKPPARRGWRSARNIAIAFVLLSLAAFLLWEFGTWIIWDGRAEYQIRVHTNAVPFDSVYCIPLGRREDADWLLENWNMTTEFKNSESGVAKPFREAQPIKVYVWVSGHESPLGRETSYTYQRFLVVVGIKQNGETTGKIVELPRPNSNVQSVDVDLLHQ